MSNVRRVSRMELGNLFLAHNTHKKGISLKDTALKPSDREYEN